MADSVTLGQVEPLVAQLTPQEQIRLIAHISAWLSERQLPEAPGERWRRNNAARVRAFLKMSEEMSAKSVAEIDSAEDIRRIREERMSRL